MEIDLLNNEFPLFVLLTLLVGPCVGPPDHSLASLTKYITNAMKASDETPIFRRPNSYVDTVVKQIRSA